jgi:rhodanese-related sulfurtransferase
MNRLRRFIILLLPLAALLIIAAGPAWSPVQAQDNRSGQTEPDKLAAKPVFRTISAVEAAQMINTRKDLQVIDVRTPQERKQFRIAGTELVPVGDVIRGVFKPELSRPIILVCAVGGRSYVAGKFMFARGYREIYNMEGGIESWRRAGLPLETGPEENNE